MQYFVRHGYASPIQGPMDLDDITGLLLVGELSWECQVHESDNQPLGELHASPGWLPVSSLVSPSLPAGTSSERSNQTPVEYQQLIRSETCYAFVRWGISLLTGLGIAVTVIYGLVTFLALSRIGSASENFFLFILEVLVVGLAILAQLVSKHFLLAILDIADAAMEHNRRKNC